MHRLFPALLYTGLGIGGLACGLRWGEPRTHLYFSLVPGLGFLIAGVAALFSSATGPRALRAMSAYVVPAIGVGWRVGGAWFDRSAHAT